jgi:hypothetical protein
MSLASILPIREIERILGELLRVVEYRLDEIETVILAEPGMMPGASLRIWDRVVTHSNMGVDPLMLADRVRRRDPRMFEVISDVVGEASIRDFYFVRAELAVSGRKYRTAAQLAVAHVFPNDLLLMDILLSNPYKPIPRQQRVSELQAHSGYGVLGKVVDNLLQCANRLGCEAITLTAASIELMPIFKRHGFVVDDTPTGRSALKHDLGPPMHRAVGHQADSRGH